MESDADGGWEPSWKYKFFSGRQPIPTFICYIADSTLAHSAQMQCPIQSHKPSINHLLFMDDLKLYARSDDAIDSLVRTVQLFSQDIGMEFGVKKCAVVSMRRRNVVECKGIDLLDGQSIAPLSDDGYKYLGILEIDAIKHTEMKNIIKKEYFRRMKTTLRSRLNERNVILAINSWAVSVLRYGAGAINWTEAELQELDRKTRKTLTMHGALNPNSNVN